jgi:2-aminoadipate transaminase
MASTQPVERARSGTGQPPETEQLLRFRDRLERAAHELTHEYDELLGRLSYAAVPVPTVGPTIYFARGAPSLDIIDVAGLRDAATRAFESDPAGTTAYGTSIGYPRLRTWIADRHGVEPERVLVTNGSMQADAFLFDHLVRPDDEVIVERPTYDRTLLSLRQRRARLHAVELQPDGIDTDALARLLGGGAGARPKLAHIIPNFQNPAGYTLSLEKRRTLLALAAAHGFVVFEDDPYVALRFSGEPLPTMLSMDPDRVVYASSFSKTVCPGIRVGYLVGPPEVIDAIAQLATNTYISPNMVAQSIVYEFCASGAIERSIETVRTALSERAAALGSALRRELPEAEFVAPEGGYFMWVTLPAGADVHALHRAAAERGVAFVKGTDFLLDGGENTLRLAYSGVTPAQIDEGIARLAQAFRSLP